MDNFEPGLYTERVLEAVKLLSHRVLPNFANKVDGAVKNMTHHPIPKDVDENEFIDASRLVYEGVSLFLESMLVGAKRRDSTGQNLKLISSEINTQLHLHACAYS